MNYSTCKTESILSQCLQKNSLNFSPMFNLSENIPFDIEQENFNYSGCPFISSFLWAVPKFRRGCYLRSGEFRSRVEIECPHKQDDHCPAGELERRDCCWERIRLQDLQQAVVELFNLSLFPFGCLQHLFQQEIMCRVEIRM